MTCGTVLLPCESPRLLHRALMSGAGGRMLAWQACMRLNPPLADSDVSSASAIPHHHRPVDCDCSCQCCANYSRYGQQSATG